MKIYLEKFFSAIPGIVKRSMAAMLCMFVIGLFVAYGCKKTDIPPTGGGNGNGNGNDTTYPNDTIYLLEGTKWKLMGIVNDQTSVLEELKPKDCEECYTLTFDTDSTAIVHSISKEIKMDLFNLPVIKNPMWPDIPFLEYKDGISYMDAYVFWRAVTLAYYYVFISNELRLYHYDACGRVSYLRFKKIES